MKKRANDFRPEPKEAHYPQYLLDAGMYPDDTVIDIDELMCRGYIDPDRLEDYL